MKNIELNSLFQQTQLFLKKSADKIVLKSTRDNGAVVRALLWNLL